MNPGRVASVAHVGDDLSGHDSFAVRDGDAAIAQMGIPSRVAIIVTDLEVAAEAEHTLVVRIRTLTALHDRDRAGSRSQDRSDTVAATGIVDGVVIRIIGVLPPPSDRQRDVAVVHRKVEGGRRRILGHEAQQNADEQAEDLAHCTYLFVFVSLR